MTANLVQYTLGNSTPITAVIWSDNPIKDVVAFEEVTIFLSEEEIPIVIACPIINNLEIKDTWQSTTH